MHAVEVSSVWHAAFSEPVAALLDLSLLHLTILLDSNQDWTRTDPEQLEH